MNVSKCCCCLSLYVYFINYYMIKTNWIFYFKFKKYTEILTILIRLQTSLAKNPNNDHESPMKSTTLLTRSSTRNAIESIEPKNFSLPKPHHANSQSSNMNSIPLFLIIIPSTLWIYLEKLIQLKYLFHAHVPPLTNGWSSRLDLTSRSPFFDF